MNVIQPAIISEHYRSRYVHWEKKNNNMVYLCTGFTMLPLHRNVGMEPKRRLAYADFYRMQIVAKKKNPKNIESGAKGEGQSGFRKQDIFFCLNSPLTSLPPCFEAMKKICYCGAPVWILPIVATVSKNFKINLEVQNYVHFYIILSRNVKIFGIMASL